jgi:hypothetical protein
MQADKVQARLAGDHPAVLERVAARAEHGQVDPGEAGVEPGAPDDVGRLQRAAVLQQGRPSRTPATLGTRWIPAAARSRCLVRTSGRPWEVSLGRALRPIGVLVVRTRWNTSRNTSRRNTSRRSSSRRSSSRAAAPPMRNGTWPTSRPDSQVRWVGVTSRSISAPELPAPTTRTSPSRNWAGLR